MATPVTIITGFLGAGKTTLMRRILTEHHGLRIAVIENEFSEDAGVESLILKSGLGGPAADGFYELSNGCLCCTAKDDLVATLEKLVARRERFDRVLIETSGLADPGPVAAAFWGDAGAEPAFALDGVVCVVDAGRICAQLAARRAAGAVNEAARQVALADVVLLNKADTAAAGGEGARAAVRAINGAARLQACSHAEVDLGALLRLCAYSARAEAAGGGVEGGAEGGGGGGGGCAAHSHAPGEACGGGGGGDAHAHDSGITTVLLRAPAPLQRRAFMEWAAALLWEQGEAPEGAPQPQRVLRGKGVLQFAGEGGAGGGAAAKHIFQSVEAQFDVQPAEGAGALWAQGEARESRVILIGWGLRRELLQAGLSACAAAGGAAH
jgi:G3E family GTPase